MAIADLGAKPDIERIIETLHELAGAEVIYEPEQFPAAIVHVPLSEGNRATILLFSSGRLVCVGLRREEDIRVAIERLRAFLK